MKVLVVDDDKINRDILERMLKKLGYESHSVKSGSEALQFLRTNACDLVYLDCYMAGISGFETARRIRAEESGARIPIIALTGVDESDELYRSGMDDYLGKPFTIDELRSSTEKWLGRKP
jgi:CheY-like chemotaxis protein